jgi:two-component SAPR family response regulator
MQDDAATGRRVLVVEDEMLIAILMEDTLAELGCVVVGPVCKLDVAMRMAREEVLDGAVLDINISGGKTFGVAECLMSRGIPFVLASGYSDWTLPESLRDKPRLPKPFTMAELGRQIKALIDARAPGDACPDPCVADC